MDNIDKELKELIDNRCCISNPVHLERLAEGHRMFEKCATCQTSKTGEGYGEVPPTKEWLEEDEECEECEALKWFKEHGM